MGRTVEFPCFDMVPVGIVFYFKKGIKANTGYRSLVPEIIPEYSSIFLKWIPDSFHGVNKQRYFIIRDATNQLCYEI